VTLFSLAGTTSGRLHDDARGEHYRVDIAIPEGPPPAAGWPALYLLDAGGCFGTCVEALRRMGRRPDATGVSPMAIVGVSPASLPGGPGTPPQRQRDFTSDRLVEGGHSGSGDIPGTAGGAPGFLDFLEHVVKPHAGGVAPLDPARDTLFGHSLAGYFTLWALCNRPGAFRNHAAISPSIWWDRDGLFASLASLRGAAGAALLLVGEWEDGLSPWQAASAGAAQMAARRAARRMVGNVEDFGAALAARLGPSRVSAAVLPNEDHASIVSAAIPRALRLASSS
jgi:predicted alpha/beta superfamily hydrolase